MCPVSSEEIEKRGKKCEVRRYGRFQGRVLDYLKNHSDKSFSQKEISEVMKTSEQQSRLTLMSLVKKGLVGRYEIPTVKEYEDSKGNVVKRTFFGIFYRYEGK